MLLVFGCGRCFRVLLCFFSLLISSRCLDVVFDFVGVLWWFNCGCVPIYVRLGWALIFSIVALVSGVLLAVGYVSMERCVLSQYLF